MSAYYDEDEEADTSSLVFIKRIPDPFDFILPFAGNQNCIEAAEKIIIVRCQIMMGGACQFKLLGGGDAGGCAHIHSLS